VDGLALFVGYAAGMGLVIGVTALAVALVRVSAVARIRRAAGFVPRIGGAVLVVTGCYVAYYGRYELRIGRDPGRPGRDPVIGVAGDIQHRLAGMVGTVGAGRLVAVLAALLLIAIVAGRCRRVPGPPAGQDLQVGSVGRSGR
jgi:hypothetical protein